MKWSNLPLRPGEQASAPTIVQEGHRRSAARVHRQRGSHIVLVRDDPYAQVVVPAHRSLATGTLGDILDGAGLTLEQFIDLL